MPKRTRTDETEEKPSEPAATMRLRLKQNAFVGIEGEFTKARTVRYFPHDEGGRLLRTTDLWEHAE